MDNILLRFMILFIFASSLSIKLTISCHLLNTIMKNAVIPSSNFEDARDTCSTMNGELLRLNSHREAIELAEEMNRIYDCEEMWIGVEKKNFLTYQWINGDYFYKEIFNTSTHYASNHGRACGSLRTWKSPNGKTVKYEIDFTNCYEEKKAICQAKADKLSGYIIASITLSVIILAAILAWIIWKLFQRYC